MQVSLNGTSIESDTQNFLGQRVTSVAGSSTTDFHYDLAGHLITEGDGSGNTLREYVWLGHIPLALIDGGVIDYIHTGNLGTPRLMTDANQNVTWDGGGSDPFMLTELPATPAMYLRLPGQYFDGETGLHYNHFRDYDPTLGRYIESDPIGLRGGINTYAYVNGNPLNYVDPYGLSALGDAGSFLGGWTGGIVGGLGGEAIEPVGGGIPGEVIGWKLGSTGGRAFGEWLDNLTLSKALPPGYWAGDKGAREWGRRAGCGAKEGRNRFHQGVKQKDSMSRPTDKYGVDPNTGDVIDPEGNYVGNLNNDY